MRRFSSRSLCSLSALTASLLVAPIHAQQAYLDFGSSSETPASGGVTYNNVEVDPRSSGSIEEVSLIMNGAASTTEPAPLLDTENNTTGWGFEIDSLTTAGTIDDNGSEWDGPYPDSLGAIEASALRSMFYCNRNKRVRFTLSGLDDNATYNLRFYPSHDQVGNSSNSIIDFIPVTGSGASFVVAQVNSYVNTTVVLQWDEVSSEDGLIVFEAQCRREAWFNFMSIEQVGGGNGEENPLTILPSTTGPGNFDFQWGSRANKVYDLVSSTDLSTDPGSWQVWQGQSGIVPTPPLNTISNVPGGPEARRFFAVIERDP